MHRSAGIRMFAKGVDGYVRPQLSRMLTMLEALRVRQAGSSPEPVPAATARGTGLDANGQTVCPGDTFGRAGGGRLACPELGSKPRKVNQYRAPNRGHPSTPTPRPDGQEVEGEKVVMDDTERYEKTRQMNSVWRDLEIGDEYQDRLVALCDLVILDEQSVDDPDVTGEFLLALALAAAADLPERRGRWVSATPATVIRLPQPTRRRLFRPVQTQAEREFWFYVTRRLNQDDRTRLRIWVPRSVTNGVWLVEFSGDLLTDLRPED